MCVEEPTEMIGLRQYFESLARRGRKENRDIFSLIAQDCESGVRALVAQLDSLEKDKELDAKAREQLRTQLDKKTEQVENLKFYLKNIIAPLVSDGWKEHIDLVTNDDCVFDWQDDRKALRGWHLKT